MDVHFGHATTDPLPFGLRPLSSRNIRIALLPCAFVADAG